MAVEFGDLAFRQQAPVSISPGAQAIYALVSVGVALVVPLVVEMSAPVAPLPFASGTAPLATIASVAAPVAAQSALQVAAVVDVAFAVVDVVVVAPLADDDCATSFAQAVCFARPVVGTVAP